MEVQALLRSQKKCLLRFLELSEQFLSGNRALEGDLSQLSEFQTRREGILKAYDLYDRKLSEVVASLGEEGRDPETVGTIKDFLAEKEILIQRIAGVDQKIISLIEKESERAKEEIESSKKGKSLVGKFKSSWVGPSGGEVDQKL